MCNLLTTYAIDVFEPIAKWASVAVVAALIIAGIIMFFAKKDAFKKFVKIALFGLLVYLLVVGLIGLIMEIGKSFDPSYVQENYMDRHATTVYLFIPIACLFVLFLATVIVSAIMHKKATLETAKKTITIMGIIDLIALVVTGVLIAIFFEKVKEWYPNLNQTVLYVSSALVIIVIVALGFILNKNDQPIDTKCLSLAGVTVAMSFGLSYVKIFEMPQGGSITLFSLLPIMIFSFIYGTKKGVFVCFIYGVLQAIQDPWIIHPAQFLLDYPVAFAAIGLSGAFAQLKVFEKLPQVSFLLGGILSASIRFFSHVLSGVFAFSSTYAGDLNSWLYSLGYNSFVFIDMAIVLAIGVIVFSSKAFMNELKKSI
ncbi:MAG: energy-coupled thiamine transporter ThiT [Clostridia bacterium]|nr:energy-coupled thiamine transporter ThiT [Clostridia bacterium]